MYDFEGRQRERNEAQSRLEKINMAEEERLNVQARQLSEAIIAYYENKVSGDFYVNVHKDRVAIIKGHKALMITLKADDTYQLAREEDLLAQEPNVQHHEQEQNLQKANMMDLVDKWCLTYGG